jgi:predicted DNA-binding protein (MmcQ/YjbR family)
VPLNKVDGEAKSTQPVEVINVKVDQERIKDYLSRTGIYEAFHMNKKCWVSIILDDTLPDETIQGMIDDSTRNIQG